MKALKEGDIQSNGKPYYISNETFLKSQGYKTAPPGLSISDVKQNKREWRLKINLLGSKQKGADLQMFLNKSFGISK